MSDCHNAYEQVLSYWDQRARQAATDCERVEWSRRTQRMRFETFLLSHDLRGKSVLDLGCGVADFYEHLCRRGISCEYAGVDISAEMIRRCSERFPQVSFQTANVLQWEPGRTFDYTVAFGIHNIRAAGGRELLAQTTRRQFQLSRIAAHVSLLTDRFAGFAAHIQPWRAEDLLSLALEITPCVVLRLKCSIPASLSITTKG